MSVVVRVDDRLVHGQVVVGWGRAMRLRHLILVDDAISESDWEQELYRMGVPNGMDVEFASVARAGAGFAAWDANGNDTMVLVGSVETLVQLCDTAPVTQVHLGGIHQGPQRRQRLPYVFLSDVEARQLSELANRGVVITAQDVPTARPVPLREVLR